MPKSCHTPDLGITQIYCNTTLKYTPVLIPSMPKPNLRPKVRIVFHENEQGIQSYFYLEKTECERAINILKILPEAKDWIPASVLGEMIGAKTPATLSVLLKMAGALRIDIKLPTGKRQVLAERPVLVLRKDPHYIGNVSGKKMYLRSRVWVRGS